MVIIKNMPLKCWHCFDNLVPDVMWYWRPVGYQGIVCHECAESYLSGVTIMIRQYNWRNCAICYQRDPDHYATCDNDFPIPTSHGFHLSCFTEATKKGEFCNPYNEGKHYVPVYDKKFIDLVQIAVVRVVQLEETKDDNNGIPNVGNHIEEAGWRHNFFICKPNDVLDVKYAPWSTSTFCKRVLISWRLALDREDDLPITFRCWESYSLLVEESYLEAEMGEKADRMFEEKVWARTVFE